MKIALFVTCLTEQYHPRAAQAVVLVLEQLGHEVVFPEAQTCCGQPMFNNGYHDDARDLARHMLEVFEPYETIVTPSGSCAAMVREHFPVLFPEGTAEHAEAVRLATRTYEFVEFLTKVEGFEPDSSELNWEGSATYHYSCHLRGLEIGMAAAELAKQIDGVEYRSLEKVDQCCGFGGTFCLKYPDLSGNMVNEKVECIRATGAATVICNDAGCAMNIEGACRRQKVAVEVKSLAEVIAEGMGLLAREYKP